MNESVLILDSSLIFSFESIDETQFPILVISDPDPALSRWSVTPVEDLSVSSKQRSPLPWDFN